MITAVEYRGFEFDQIQATIEEPEGIGLASIDDSFTELSQREGSKSLGWRMLSRTFGWKSTLKKDTAAEYLALRQEFFHALVPSLVDGYTMTFTILGDQIRTLPNVRCIDAPLNISYSEPSIIWNTYSIAFRSDYPYFLGDETDETQGKTEYLGGSAIPAAIPMSLSAAFTGSPSDPLVVTNAGNAPAYPVFTITGSGTEFTVINSTTGKQFVIDATLTAGQTITVDTWKKTVVRSDGASILNLFDGDFFTIEGGGAGSNNTILFAVTSGDSSDTQLRTVFSDTYFTL